VNLLGIVLSLLLGDLPATPATPRDGVKCEVETDIPDMEVNLQKVCARGGVEHPNRPMFGKVKFTGNHDRAVWEFTYNNTYEWRGMTVAGTKMASDAWDTAVAIHEILQWPNAYPTKLLVVGIRDRESRPICAFSFDADHKSPIEARCVDTIE